MRWEIISANARNDSLFISEGTNVVTEAACLFRATRCVILRIKV